MRLALFASLLVIAAPALATSNDEAPKAEKEKKICRDSGERSESRLRKRVCKTAEEWANDRQGASVSDLKRIGN
jgi:hypothetical protein